VWQFLLLHASFDFTLSVLSSSLLPSMTHNHMQEEVAEEVPPPELDDVVEETIEAGMEDDEKGKGDQ
jgi:hypothetical protein